MVSWTSPDVLQTSAHLINRICGLSFGVTCWYHITTFGRVEWPLLTQKLPWRWSYLYYLGARYALVGCFVVTVWGQCLAIRHLGLLGGITSACASGNLLVRTAALWQGSTTTLIFLTILGIGHWVIVVSVGMAPFKGVHAGDYTHCFSSSVSRFGIQLYIYTGSLDFLVMLATLIGLFRLREARDTPLWATLYRQGIFYFFFTFSLNIPLLVLTILHLNAWLDLVFAPLYLTFSVIASSAAVISLIPKAHDRSTSQESASEPEGTQSRSNGGALSTNIRFSTADMSNDLESLPGLTLPQNTLYTIRSPLPPPSLVISDCINPYASPKAQSSLDPPVSSAKNHRRSTSRGST